MVRHGLFLIMTILLVSICGRSMAQRPPKDKILDKKVFTVTMEPQTNKKKQEESFEEELNFRSNKLTALRMRSADSGAFQGGEYAIREKEEVMGEVVYHFEGINKNSKGLSLKWSGKVFGDQIEGSATVSKNGKIKEEYLFKGELKKK